MEAFNFILFLSRNCRFTEAMWVSAQGRCDAGIHCFFRFARGFKKYFIHSQTSHDLGISVQIYSL